MGLTCVCSTFKAILAAVEVASSMRVLANVVPVSDVIYSATTHIANSGYSIISGPLDVTVLKR